ncbi:MAG: bifunctional ADP-heptose synthase [Flavobacteriales bacterium]|nr:MAG: bifunctional ADP-heptose synthase [Flavobacteriales bacterium]
MSGAGRFLDRAAGTTVLVVGDVMVDAYLWGRVDRISPEAPVPVVQVTHRSARLGGAANVALNVKALGGRAIIAATVGEDANADLITRLFHEQELVTDGLVRSPFRRTTVKTRVISGHQHVVRVDEEQEDDLRAEDEELLLERIALVIRNDRPGVMVLEDYNKGVLTARVIEGAVALAREAGIPVAVDPKKKNFLAYRGVTLFKPNLKELREGLKTDVDPADDASVERAVRKLAEQLGNALSLVTLSEHGAYVHDGAHGTRIAAHKRRIVDVSGAGDTVIAVAALCLAQGLPPVPMAALANLAGGLVCEEVGVVPIDRERFRAECERLGLPA